MQPLAAGEHRLLHLGKSKRSSVRAKRRHIGLINIILRANAVLSRKENAEAGMYRHERHELVAPIYHCQYSLHGVSLIEPIMNDLLTCPFVDLCDMILWPERHVYIRSSSRKASKLLRVMAFRW